MIVIVPRAITNFQTSVLNRNLMSVTLSVIQMLPVPMNGLLVLSTQTRKNVSLITALITKTSVQTNPLISAILSDIQILLAPPTLSPVLSITISKNVWGKRRIPNVVPVKL